MEKESLFIQLSTGYGEKKKLGGAKKFLKKELEEDFSVFSDEERSLVELHIQGKPIPPEQSIIFTKALNRWWKSKYGFSYDNIVARNEVLARKYAPSESQKEKKRLSEELLLAVAENREEKVRELKKRYQKEFPDELEGVEVIFGLLDAFENEKKLEVVKGEDRKKIFRELTEYQFLFTHYLLMNGDDKEFLEKFWEAARTVAGQAEKINELNILRRGQVSQVAVHRVFEALGQRPKIAHPDEDAFDSIDLWAESDEAIQIKGWDEEAPAVIESDHIAFPAMQVDSLEDKKKARLYNSAEYFQRGAGRSFRAKVEKYGQRTGRDITGHMLVVPYSKIDFVTGEPAPELVEFFKKELKKSERPAEDKKAA